MNFKKIWLAGKTYLQRPQVVNFDRKLIHRLRGNKFPSRDQLRYLPRFLNNTEKIILGIATIIGAISASGLIILFLSQHITTSPRTGGEYSEAMVGQPKFINPIFAPANDIDADISSLVFSGLFHYNAEQKLLPDLAQSYSVSDDKKIYDITLRQDARWSDNEPFTADDVIFTFATIVTPEVGSPLLPTFQGVTVEKTGQYSVRFTLKEPFAPFLSTLTVGIIPEHAWGAIQPANMRLAALNLQPIGTGPWAFNKLAKDALGTIPSYTLTQNTHYYGKKPYLKTVVFKFFTTTNDAVDALRSQHVSAVSFVPQALKDKLPGKTVIAHTLQLPQYTAIFFNEDNQPLLKNDSLRHALSAAIDKTEVLHEALHNEGDIIHSPFLPGAIGYNPTSGKIDYDIDAANTLLDANWSRVSAEDYFAKQKEAALAQFVASNASSTPTSSTSAAFQITSSTTSTPEQQISDAIRAQMDPNQTIYRFGKKDNTPLKLTLTTVDNPEYTKAAETIVKMWRRLGIQVKINALPARQINKEVFKDRNYEVLLYGELIGLDPDPYPFWHSSQIKFPGLNLAMFSDRTADKLLEDARTTSDTDARAKLYGKFQDILNKEIPAIFLYTPTYTFAVSTAIQGVNATHIVAPSDRYADINEWYIKTTWHWRS